MDRRVARGILDSFGRESASAPATADHPLRGLLPRPGGREEVSDNAATPGDTEGQVLAEEGLAVAEESAPSDSGRAMSNAKTKARKRRSGPAGY